MKYLEIIKFFLLKVFKLIWFLPRHSIVFLITIYQKTLSPDHGPLKKLFPYGYCRFHPSCSNYTKEIILKRGLIIGSILGAYRILRCNPFSKGGIDLPK